MDRKERVLEDYDDYYTPAEVMQFTPEHIIWLLEVMQHYEPGEWPPKRGETIAPNDQTNHADFEASCIAMAELSWRIDRTGTDGRKLKEQIIAGARTTQSLDFAPRQALYYCCGRWRKLLPYMVWRLKVIQNRLYKGG